MPVVPFDQTHLERRAEIHAALGDPARLAIVDELTASDRSPSELSTILGLRPPLLAFHLDTLERAGLITRVTSSGDRRRRYVQLVPSALDTLARGTTAPTGPVVFVCTRNSARSQLAAALWRRRCPTDATSAGTHPAEQVHPGAIAAAQRAGVDLAGAMPRLLDPATAPEHIITVCDQAHEALSGTTRHWSIPDPVGADPDRSDATFDRVVDLITARIATIAPERTPERTPQRTTKETS